MTSSSRLFFSRSSTALTTLFLSLAAGCGGGGSDSTSEIAGLQIADSMAVVTTNEGSSLGVVTPHAQADTSGFAATCDYNTDPSRAHVYDPSMQPLQTVNMILCLIKQTAYSDIVNEGLYKAQVDELSCNQGGDSSGTGQSSGTQQSFNVWVIENTRASADAAQVCEFWIPPMSGDDQKQIRVRMTITEGRTEANPFGVFDLNWIEVDLLTDETVGFGNLHTLDADDGYVGFSFYQENGDVTVVPPSNSSAELVQANVRMSVDQTEGVARIQTTRRENYSGDTGQMVQEFAVAYDPTHLRRWTLDGSSVVSDDCLSRVDFSTRTWRYNLYDATNGDRIERNSGFGFQTTQGDYGWVGYHGLWLPGDASLETGDTVTRNSFGQATPETYTVLVAPGKLIRNTRQTLGLTELTGVVFEWWHPSLVGGFQMVRDHVEYQAPNWVATERYDQNTQTWTPFGSPVTIDVAALGFLGMYSESLGGPCSYLHGDDSILYFTRRVVGPNDTLFAQFDTISLLGYFNCLDSEITTAEANVGDVYLPDETDLGSPYVFTINQADMSFTRNTTGNPVVGLGVGQAPTTGPNTWGMTSGPMVTSATWATLTTTQDIWNVAEFYTYETGANPWNQFVTVLDENSDAVEFDAPLQFAYTHTTADDANVDPTFDGRTYLLHYSGAGDLGGIPFTGVDFDGDTEFDRFYPEFSILSGTLCGPTGTEYVIRAIESEQTLASDTGNCTGLDVGVATALVLPTVGTWTDPAMGASPTVTDAPRVIDGRDVASGN